MRRPVLALVLTLSAVAVGCAGAAAGGADDAPLAYLPVWAGFGTELDRVEDRAREACADDFGTWFADWGARGAACVAAQALARDQGAEPGPAALLASAPMAPFESGPHSATALDLDAPRAFGRYDPAFVRWLTRAAIPTGDTEVALLRPTYRRHFARTARIYWLTHRDLAAGGFPARTPAGAAADYAAFLDGGPVPDGSESYGLDGERNGGFSVFAFTDQSERLLPEIGVPVDNDWTAKYEANTAYGFWLRRRADGTHGEWRAALARLLSTFDADWLAAHSG